MSTPPLPAKVELRRSIRARLDTLSRAERAVLSRETVHQLASLLLGMEVWQRNEVLGVYLAAWDEVDLDPLLLRLLEQGISLAAPRTGAGIDTPTFGRLLLPLPPRPEGRSLRQPQGDEVQTPSVLLVPGLAFDAQGGRLGRGGGWYDRVLGEARYAIGVAFPVQVVAQVPREDHDRPVDAVVTSEGWHASGHWYSAAPVSPGESPR